MGEKMNRISTTWLTLGTVAGIFALGTACSSGGSGGDGGTSGSSTGTSGSGTGGTTSGTPSVCDGAATYALPIGLAYIDNFETATNFDGWYSFSDTTPPNMPKPERVMPGALSTMYSGHVTAMGIKSSKAMGYGAGFGFNVVDPAKGKCVDLTAFDGISFWAKGTAGTDNTLKFQIVSPATQPTNETPAGDCTPMTACAFAHPAKVITLTAAWSQIIIKWTDLAPAAAFKGKALAFNMITDGPNYDVNIDEVTFFSGTAPATAVMPPTAAGGSGGSGGGTGGTGGGGGTGGT